MDMVSPVTGLARLDTDVPASTPPPPLGCSSVGGCGSCTFARRELASRRALPPSPPWLPARCCAGTHVAGTIAGAWNNAAVAGVVGSARLAACKFMDSTGSGSLSDAISCIKHAAAVDAHWVENHSCECFQPLYAPAFMPRGCWGGPACHTATHARTPPPPPRVAVSCCLKAPTSTAC
jgi:hypothetical protein